MIIRPPKLQLYVKFYQGISLVRFSFSQAEMQDNNFLALLFGSILLSFHLISEDRVDEVRQLTLFSLLTQVKRKRGQAQKGLCCLSKLEIKRERKKDIQDQCSEERKKAEKELTTLFITGNQTPFINFRRQAFNPLVTSHQRPLS